MNGNIKIYLIAGILTLILGVGFIFYIIFGSNQESKIQVTTKDNSKFVTENFLTNKKIIENTVYVAENEKYSILYDYKVKDFTIEVYGYNRNELVESRKQAETKFLEIMQTTQEEVCKLPVSLIVPASYNEQYSVIDYGLSICPGSNEFESELPPSNVYPEEQVEEQEPINFEGLR